MTRSTPDLDAAGLAEVRAFGAATLHEAQGQTGALRPAIKPLAAALRLAGPALTIEVKPGDNLVIHQAITLSRPGDVLVIDAKGDVDCGLWGDLLTLAAQCAGIAGLVIDGAVRDSEAIVALGFPVFTAGVCINAPRKTGGGAINRSIVCGGVRVRPGDLIVGDRDGVVSVERARVDDVVRQARRREEREEAVRAGLRAGRTTLELLDLAMPIAQAGLA